MLKRIIKRLAKLIWKIMPAILAGDILYLYFAGAWIEPNKAILVTELIMLAVVIILSVAITIKGILSR